MILPSIQGLIGGSLTYPEHEMMIGTTTKCIDVHALGAEKDKLPAALNMGFRKEFASKVTADGMDPSMMTPGDYLDFIGNIKLRPPLALPSNKCKLSRPEKEAKSVIALGR